MTLKSNAKCIPLKFEQTFPALSSFNQICYDILHLFKAVHSDVIVNYKITDHKNIPRIENLLLSSMVMHVDQLGKLHYHIERTVTAMNQPFYKITDHKNIPRIENLSLSSMVVYVHPL